MSQYNDSQLRVEGGHAAKSVSYNVMVSYKDKMTTSDDGLV